MSGRVSASAAFRVSALLGFAGVALGAFGAHWLKDGLEKRHMTDIWKTAVLYHLVHAVVMLGLASHPRFRSGVWMLFGVGIVVFSGSLYALALGAPALTGILTPFGGVFFLGGYAALAWQARSWTTERP